VWAAVLRTKTTAIGRSMRRLNPCHTAPSLGRRAEISAIWLGRRLRTYPITEPSGCKHP
jgi:hypothetical protein